jgi:hypothetical protein
MILKINNYVCLSVVSVALNIFLKVLGTNTSDIVTTTKGKCTLSNKKGEKKNLRH